MEKKHKTDTSAIEQNVTPANMTDNKSNTESSGDQIQNVTETNSDLSIAQNETPELSTDVQNQDTQEELLQQTQKEVEAWKDKYIRLMAEFENYKKRVRQEKIEWQKSCLTELIRNLLPVLDDFERGLKSMNAADESQLSTFKNGYELIYNKFFNTLKQYGLEPIEELTDFDTDLHEAISTVNDPERKGKVIEVVEKGYKLEGKVIRFAKVIVAN